MHFIIRCIFNGVRISGQRPLSPTNYGLCLASALQRNEPLLFQNKHFSLDKKDSPQLTTEPSKQTAAEKLKKAAKEYGATVIVFHVGISLISLGSCYVLVSTGLDLEQLLVTLKLDDILKGNKLLVSNASTFAVAYAIHKVFAPVRITVTLGSVPFIVKYLRAKGILRK